MTAYTFDQLITFTRTSAATYVGSNGLVAVTPASRNLLIYTQDFDNAAWTKTNAQVVPNVDPATATFGVELVTNGDFSAGATGWTVAPGGTGSVTGGQAVITDSGAASNVLLRQVVATVAGRLYRITYNVVSTNQNTAAYLGSVLGASIAGTGTRTFYLVAAANNANLEIVCATVNGIVTIDNVSVREVIGGLIAAPDGTPTGDALVEDTINSRHSLSQTATIAASATHTVSVYVKAGTGRYFTLSVSRAAAGSVYYAARYDLQTATVTATGTGGGGGTHTASSITAVGNGWYRCVLTGTLSTFTDAVVMASGAINPTGFGDRGAEVYIGTNSTWLLWGAQLEAASAASTYTRNNGGVYPPRFDYDPVTRAPRGLLIEEQRTNLLTYSEQFDNAAWVKTNATITANAVVSPDGTADADKLVESTGTGSHRVTPTGAISLTSGTTYTATVYAKSGERTRCAIITYTGATDITSVFDLSAGSVVSGPGTITAVGGGWYRLSQTYTAAATLATIYAFQVALNDGSSNSYTGDGTSGIFIYGAQLEAGAFATSYIPTVASQVTRTADVAAITAPMFAPWYNQSEGTFVVQWDGFKPTTASGVPHIFQVGNGSNSFIDTVLSGPNYLARVTTGGVDQSAISTAYAANSVEKIASAYKLNDFAFSRNGAAVLMDTSGTPPTGIDRMGVGVSQSGTFALNGHIRSIDYYPTRLTNAQIQALTA